MKTERIFISIVLLSTFLICQSKGAQWNQPANTWVKRNPLPGGPPVPRLGYEGACAWDSSRDLFIRYGGHNQGGGGAQYSEIWTWNPRTNRWTLKEPDISPPGVCCAQQNLFDPTSNRYVRFPAFSGSHGWQWFREIYLNDSTVWVYALETNRWKDLRPLPAPHVSGLRCASWDSDEQVMVLFGGEGNREGTVVYDPHSNTWTRMNPPAEPAFRSAGNMVYDEANKRHILFGSQFTDDSHTWAYNLRANRWTDMKPPQQPPTDRNDAVLAYDCANRVVVAVIKITTGEGENAGHTLQTWTYNTAENRWTRMNPHREPDATGNRSRVIVYADSLGMSLLENRTRSRPGPPEQQLWTYCYKSLDADSTKLALRPVDIKVKTRTNGAVLNWQPSQENALSGFVLYRGAGALPWTVKYEKIAEVSAETTVFEDRNLERGVPYYYKIAAVAKQGSTVGSVIARTRPRIVEDVHVSAMSQNQVLIEWTAPAGSDVVGYHVERAPVEVYTNDQLNRIKSKLKTLPRPSVGAIKKIGRFHRITKSPVEALYYRDKVDLENTVEVNDPIFASRLYKDHLDRSGREYRWAVYAYRVRAVNALGVESGPSPAVFTIPSSPRWVFSREENQVCRLKWRSNPEKSIAGYRVYRMDGRWEKDPISRLTPEPIRETRYSDETAGEPTRRYYVVALDALGQEGMPSSPVWYNREWKHFYEPFTGAWHQ